MELAEHRTRLDEVLRLSAEEAHARVDARFLAATAGRRGFVFFGAGHLGGMMARSLRPLGLQPWAFTDNNPALHGTMLEGIPVLSPAEAIARYGHDATFVPTVYTNGPVLNQLAGFGVPAISLSLFHWHFRIDLGPMVSRWYATTVHQEAIREALGVWFDEDSRKEYVGQLRWRGTMDWNELPPYLDAKDTYFPLDLLQLSPDEVLADCGAFDGDSLRSFLQHTSGVFKAYVGFDADSQNHARLQAFINGLPPDTASRCRALRFVVGNRESVTFFNETGTWASSTSAAPNQEVPGIRLDDVLRGTPPTYIKMDVEGSERNVLEGAQEILRTHRPVLAVCLYHRLEDLWELPLLIKKIQPDYRFFLRRYCDECWEQVCYAIPAERLK